ncbi:MAG: DUF6600 domain-containing protein [Polyangiaceae bacterium]
MKASHLLTIALALLAPSVVACGAEEQEGEGAQFPQTPGADPPVGANATAHLSAPGEAPIPIDVPPTPPPSAPPPPPREVAAVPHQIVPGSTTEEEYNSRPADSESDVAVGEEGDEYADTDPSALSDFRGTLDPYGSWVDDPNFGTVWTPDPSVVGNDFAPYVTGGRWTYDDAQNWVWVSDYDWGWAPFHYGRWAYLGSSWGWIPGRQYAGAWVSWRQGYPGYDYLGWAPLPPRWGWRNGAAFGLGFNVRAPYVFCGTHDVFSTGLGGHLVTGAQVPVVGQHTGVYGGASGGANGATGNGRVAAHPTVGPPPSSVGISPGEIAHTPTNNRGVMHAQQFARPSTAQGLGAHVAVASAPSYISRRNEAVASAPQYRGISPAPYHYPSHSLGAYPAYGSAPHFGAPYSSRYGSPYAGGRYGGGYSSPYGGHYASPYAPHYASPGYAGAYGGPVRGNSGNGSSSSSGSSEDSHDDAPVHGGGRGGGYRGGGRGGGGRGGGGRR